MTNHPITPPPELLDEWDFLPISSQEILVLAAQWGADQELEACCEEFSRFWDEVEVTLDDVLKRLRAARRPKSLSLKEQALDALASLQRLTTDPNIIEPLRRALEQLPE
jgi:hypothetical protein